MTEAPELPDDRTLALIGTDAALLGLVDAVAVMVDVDDVDAADLSEALNLTTSSFAMLAASGPHAWACLERLLVTGVLAWDELGGLDARGGTADPFDADERRCFALVTKTGQADIETLTDRVLEKVGRSFPRALSVALVVTARMLWSVAEVLDLDAQGALDAVRRLPDDDDG